MDQYMLKVSRGDISFDYEKEERLFENACVLIKKLNENGYLTRFSCQGSKTGQNGYIAFDKSLSRETRLVLQKLAFNMIKQGLVVNIDSNFLNPNERPIIRFSINSISGTYDESRWALCNGRKDILLNQAVFFATSMLCGDKDDAGIAIKEMKKLSERFNIEMPLGASNLVDEVGATLVTKYGKDILKQIAKLSFKNTEKIYEIAKNR